MSLSFKDCNQHNNTYCERLNCGGKATLESCRRFRSFRFLASSYHNKIITAIQIFLKKIAFLKLNMLYIVGYRNYRRYKCLSISAWLCLCY